MNPENKFPTDVPGRLVEPLSRINMIRECLVVIEGYGPFRPGQKGHHVFTEVRKFLDSLEHRPALYGHCPHCFKAGIRRERRLNGNDTCESGHVYPSSAAVVAFSST